MYHFSHSVDPFGPSGGREISENINYCKCKQVLASLAAAAPDVKSLLEQIGTTHCILCTVLDVADSWFLYSSFQGPPESICFHWQSQQYTFKFFQNVEILMVLTSHKNHTSLLH